MVHAGAGLAVVGVTSTVALEGVPPWELDLFARLNSGPAALEPVLWVPMQVGSLWGPFVVGGVAWRRLREWRPAVGAVVAGVVAWQVAKVLKSRVRRGRPFELVEDFARLKGTPYEGLGFVSGHAAVSFSLAAVVSPYVARPWRLGLYALAALVGLARIQVSAHLPLDVVGGAALGYALGSTWNLAVGVPVDHPRPPERG